MQNVILETNKAHKGSVRMQIEADGNIRQVLTIYQQNPDRIRAVESFVSQHGKIVLSKRALYVKFRFPLDTLTAEALQDLAASLADEMEMFTCQLTEVGADDKLAADRAKITDDEITLE